MEWISLKDQQPEDAELVLLWFDESQIAMTCEWHPTQKGGFITFDEWLVVSNLGQWVLELGTDNEGSESIRYKPSHFMRIPLPPSK
jgi:hypothetical protein